MTERHDATAYKITLKTFSAERLFEEWSIAYDAKAAPRVALVIAEMNTRNTSGVIAL